MTTATVQLINYKGLCVNSVLIVGVRPDLNDILVASDAEQLEWHEERVQLLEGRSYEYRLIVSDGNQLRENDLFTRSNVRATGPDMGTIKTGLFTGTAALILENGQAEELARGFVEVRSVKLNYRTDYRAMLQSVQEVALDLLLSAESPSSAPLQSTDDVTTDSIIQKLFFVAGILDTSDFRQTIEQILRNPHLSSASGEEQLPIGRSGKLTRPVITQLQRSVRRVAVPTNHPISLMMSSVPQSLRNVRPTETLDNSSNRFVLFALKAMIRYISSALTALPAGAHALRNQISVLEDYLSALLAHEVFRSVGDQGKLPMYNLVLQRRPGYREFLQYWLRFIASSSLSWDGGDDVYSGSKKNVATLYEFWVCLQLVEAVQRCKHTQCEPCDLLQREDRGFSFRLRRGLQALLVGRATSRNGQINFRLSYNETFSSLAANGEHGTWTVPMRPDYTISFWPSNFTEQIAAKYGRIARLHFDAKYRRNEKIGFHEALARDNNEATRDSLQLHDLARANRADVNKMHAYKDGIRGSVGSYIIYPGTEDELFRQGTGTLPSIGAFPLRPKSLRDNIGLITEFLNDAIDEITISLESLSYDANET